MPSYIDLVWTGMGAFGGLLLIDSLTTTKAKLGVWIIFLGYMFQVYWEFTHPWSSDSLRQVIDISVIIIVSFAIAFYQPLVKRFKKSSRGDLGGSGSYND